MTRSVIRTKLRARIAIVHTSLDRLVNSSCLGDTLRLGRLLTIHYDALMLLVPALEGAGAEHVCPGWEGRSRLAALGEDLRALGIRPNANPVYPPSFVREPEIWGALYAVEGSRLGNRIILRRVIESGSEAERQATQFLAHGVEDRTAWGGFLARLEALQYCSEAFELAVLGAERVFETYLDLAGRYCEPGATRCSHAG
jgi:heme oxygenase (biliverdin-IX-beta and delta-forming)